MQYHDELEFRRSRVQHIQVEALVTQRFIQTLWAQFRTSRTQMGDKYSKLQISTTHPIVGWATRHAPWILTRYLRHADGKTSYERRWQRLYASPLCIFGETLCWLNRRRSYRNTPYDSTQASGLDDARFRMRIWLWMAASCFEPEQYDDFQKDQNDGITKNATI